MNTADKLFEAALEHLAGILSTAGTEHSDRVAVQIAQDRCEATALIVTVEGLLLLITVQIDKG